MSVIPINFLGDGSIASRNSDIDEANLPLVEKGSLPVGGEPEQPPQSLAARLVAGTYWQRVGEEGPWAEA